LKAFADKGAKELVGVDISEGMLIQARKSLGEKAKLIRDDLGNPDLPKILDNKKFDIIMSAWGLFYMEKEENLVTALTSIYNLLADNGTSYFILGDDKKIVEEGLEKIIQVEFLEVISGDWVGPTYCRKRIAEEFIVCDLWRPYPMLEAAFKKVGFTNVARVETLFDEEGLKVFTPEEWEKIKRVKPDFMIVASK